MSTDPVFEAFTLKAPLPLQAEDLRGLKSLTPRELECLFYVAKGLDHKQIGALLHVSHFTVTDHCKTMFRKLGVNRAIEAAVLAAKAGML